MTDRIYAFTVILEDTIREDDVEATILAIKQLRGVLEVTPLVADYAYHSAKTKARYELIDKLKDVLWPKEN